MTVIITSDTHLTDKPQDEYRWKLWPWLLEQIKQTKADELLHLGDLTDAKDRHPSRLVNRAVDCIGSVAEACKVYLLKGNHDYIDPSHPFFGFIAGRAVQYFKEPGIAELSIGKSTFIPAGVEWNFRLLEFPYTFAHATFAGAEAENGTLLPGISHEMISGYDGMLYSGDIHKPQKLRKNMEYIGAPYHVRFGDQYEPRVLVIHNDGKTTELHYPAPRKHVLEFRGDDAPSVRHVKPGDHVRIRCYLKRTEYDTWREKRDELKALAEENEWVLFSVEAIPFEIASKQDEQSPTGYMSHEQLLEAYSKKHKLSDEYMAIGKELLSDT